MKMIMQVSAVILITIINNGGKLYALYSHVLIVILLNVMLVL